MRPRPLSPLNTILRCFALPLQKNSDRAKFPKWPVVAKRASRVGFGMIAFGRRKQNEGNVTRTLAYRPSCMPCRRKKLVVWILFLPTWHGYSLIHFRYLLESALCSDWVTEKLSSASTISRKASRIVLLSIHLHHSQYHVSHRHRNH